jgi:hypothetical protein
VVPANLLREQGLILRFGLTLKGLERDVVVQVDIQDVSEPRMVGVIADDADAQHRLCLDDLGETGIQE